MAIRFSDTTRNIAAAAIVANLTILDVYTGGQPAAGGAATGTLLGSITGITWGAPAAGVVAVTGTPSDSSANATGTAGWGRFRNSGDTERMDGVVGGEFTLADPAIVSGGVITLTSASLTQPAQ